MHSWRRGPGPPSQSPFQLSSLILSAVHRIPIAGKNQINESHLTEGCGVLSKAIHKFEQSCQMTNCTPDTFGDEVPRFMGSNFCSENPLCRKIASSLPSLPTMAASQYPPEGKQDCPAGRRLVPPPPPAAHFVYELGQVILCLCFSFCYEEVMVLVSSGDNINMILVLSFVHINKWIKI